MSNIIMMRRRRRRRRRIDKCIVPMMTMETTRGTTDMHYRKGMFIKTKMEIQLIQNSWMKLNKMIPPPPHPQRKIANIKNKIINDSQKPIKPLTLSSSLSSLHYSHCSSSWPYYPHIYSNGTCSFYYQFWVVPSSIPSFFIPCDQITSGHSGVHHHWMRFLQSFFRMVTFEYYGRRW